MLQAQGAGGDWDERRERAHESETGQGWDTATAAMRDYETALQRLHEWDAAHPAVVAEIKAEKAAATQRFLAAD